MRVTRDGPAQPDLATGTRSRDRGRSTPRRSTGRPSCASASSAPCDRRMMSDVPVGVFLSGGVDSSTNVALMSRAGRRAGEHLLDRLSRRRATSTSSTGRARVAEQFGTEPPRGQDRRRRPVGLHAGARPPPGRADRRPGLRAAALRRPSWRRRRASRSCTSARAPTSCSRAIRRTSPRTRMMRRPVAQAAGAARSAALGRRPRSAVPLLGRSPVREIHAEALRRAAPPDGAAVVGRRRRVLRARARARSPRRHCRAQTQRRPCAASSRGIAEDADRFGARDELDRLIYQDLRLRLPELLLMRVDKLTMANSIEARVPFLDHELVELAMAMPRRAEDRRRRRQGRPQARGGRSAAARHASGARSRASARRWHSGSAASSARDLAGTARQLGRSTSWACSIRDRIEQLVGHARAAGARTARSSCGTCSTCRCGSTTGSPARSRWAGERAAAGRRRGAAELRQGRAGVARARSARDSSARCCTPASTTTARCRTASSSSSRCRSPTSSSASAPGTHAEQTAGVLVGRRAGAARGTSTTPCSSPAT